MTDIAVIFVLLFALYIFKVYWWRILKTRWYGTEADAYVSRIEDEKMSLTYIDYSRYYSRNCYAVFQAKNGLENEAKLLNPNKRLTEGSLIRIRYLPEKADCAILTEIKKT